jgi:hypothetical protein
MAAFTSCLIYPTVSFKTESKEVAALVSEMVTDRVSGFVHEIVTESAAPLRTCKQDIRSHDGEKTLTSEPDGRL